MGMTFIDFFAGIGGFHSGFEKAGMKCIGWCEFDKYAQKSYRAIYDMEGLWFKDDVRKVRGWELPRATIWTFGFPCQDVSIAGKQKGIKRGTRSGLFFEIMRLIDEAEENKPRWLIAENVKNLLSIEGGWGFFTVLSEMEARGYSIEWKVYNSKDYGVPQNRERVYIAGYLGRRGERALLPTARKSERVLKQVIGGAQGERVYEPNLSCTLSSQGGGSGVKTGLYIVGKIPEYSQRGIVYADSGNVGSLTATDYKSPPKVMEKKFTGLSNAAGKSGVCAVLTPDRINKRQNGRRIKEDGEPAFTITAEDRHGVMLNDGNMCCIRKLTPKECWRLQGFTDNQYEKAASVNSKSQLYKQAGNAVTVNVTYEIGQHIMGFEKDGGDEA